MTENEITLENTAALIRGYKGEIECLKEELSRKCREVDKLRQKLTALEDAAQDVSEDEDEEGFEKDDNGRYRAENDFDQRDHYREM